MQPMAMTPEPQAQGSARQRSLLSRAKALVPVLKIRQPESQAVRRRIEVMERDIVLPLKVAAIAMLLHSFYFSPWFGNVLGALDIAVQSTQHLLWVYISINVVLGTLLFFIWRLSFELVQWLAFASNLLDGILVSALTLVSGGYDSILYWLYIGLIVRASVSVPRGTSQLMLSFTLIACYFIAGLIDVNISELSQYLDEGARLALDLRGTLEDPTEPLFMRMLLLFLVAFCAYAVQVLVEHQRQAEKEARQFGFREGQLRSAGRLAAEFAHQMKNPLAIINNAVFSLERNLQKNRNVDSQIQIIREEIQRTDLIITEIMGYAQLSEGRVEKMDVRAEVEEAIARVFPPAAGYNIEVRKTFEGVFPPLLMQPRHLRDALTNVLQNAREAIGPQGGVVTVRAATLRDNSVEISIKDSGPGIAPEKCEKIFEAYYTTKEKGTGLGLASAKHNVEVYGGKIRVESELGKGARFILSFPTAA